MKLMPEYNEKMLLHYIMLKILILEVAGSTSLHVPSQCLPINFNILNGKKILYRMTTAAVHRQCDFFNAYVSVHNLC